MQTLRKLAIVFLFLSIRLAGQDKNIQTRLESGELKMSFPSIYFKHNSTDYADMPYSVDSCYKFIAKKMKELNSFPVWRDSGEKERLTILRIQKLRDELDKYVSPNKIQFQSMGSAQKIEKLTIQKAKEAQINYLLSLNSVLDMSGAILNKSGKVKKQRRGIPRLVWCGWQYGFHWSSKGKGVHKG